MYERAAIFLAASGGVYALGVMFGPGVAVGAAVGGFILAWGDRERRRADEFNRRQTIREAAWRAGDRRGQRERHRSSARDRSAWR